MNFSKFYLFLILAALFIVNLPGSADAASIVAVPGTSGGSEGYAVSNDGTVVGYTTVSSQRRAFVWNAGLAGVVILDDVAGGIERGEARDISADGTTVVGHASWGTDVNTSHVAASWTRPGAAWTATSPAAQRLNPTNVFSRAYGVSSDGAIIVGVGGPSGGDYAAFRWTTGGGMVSITSSSSIAQGISPDGSIVAGRVNTTPSLAWYDTSWHNQGTYYIYNQPAEWGGNVTSTPSAEATAAANPQAGVNILVGQATGDSLSVPAYGNARVYTTQAMKWTSSGWTELGFLQPAPYLSGGRYYSFSRAWDVSADGTTVVGTGYLGGYGTLRAFIWDSTNGIRALASVLTSAPYNLDLTGFTLTQAKSISANGRYIIGDGGPTGVWMCDTGSNPPAITAWRSVLTHGSIGEIGVVLSSSAVNTESRRGVTKIVVDFDQAVHAADGVLDVADVDVRDSTDTSYTPAGVLLTDDDQRIEISFASDTLPANKVVTFDLGQCFRGSGEVDLAGDTDCQVRYLVGDANGDGTVDLIDVAAIKSMNREPVTAATAVYDLNGDGRINLIDAALARTFYGSSGP